MFPRNSAPAAIAGLLVVAGVLVWLAEFQAPKERLPSARIADAAKESDLTRGDADPRQAQSNNSSTERDIQSNDSVQRQWLEQQQQSKDLRTFVEEAAEAAYQGDPEAQLAVARSLYICDAALAYTDAVRRGSNPPRHLRGHVMQAARCETWSSESLFPTLPSEEGPYDLDYWIERAAASGHPVAAAWQTSMEAVAARDSQAKLDEISASLKRYAKTGKPEAWFYIGVALVTMPRSDDDRRGSAWMTLACRNSACDSVPEMLLSDPCNTPSGRVCDTEAMRRYDGRQSIGSQNAAEVNALSRRIENAIDRSAWTELDFAMDAAPSSQASTAQRP